MPRSVRRLTSLSLFLLALLPTLFFAYLGLHGRPYTDDLIRLGLASEIGVWEMMLYFRETWNTGYSGFLLIGALAPLGASATAVMSLVIIALAAAAFGWLANALCRRANIHERRRQAVVALSSLMVAATIHGFLSQSSFCWLSAAVNYTLPVILFLLGIALAAEIGPRLRANDQLLLAAATAALLSFMNVGFGAMYLMFHLTMVMLIFVFIFLFQHGPMRRVFLVLALAAALGAFAGLIAHVSSPGFAFRSSQSGVIGELVSPAREPAQLLGVSLDMAMRLLDNAKGFAGFMLLACAGLYAALETGAAPRDAAESRPVRVARSPLGLCLIIQLLFVPILWAHQSDHPQVLGRFSIAYFSVVSINLAAIVILVALLWRRGLLARLFSKRNGAMAYYCCILAAVCLLFAITQMRSIHYRPFNFLLVTAATALYMLAGQLRIAAADRRLSWLWRLSVFASASTVIVLIVCSAMASYVVGVPFHRNFSWLSFMLVISGMMWGVTIGALILREHGRSKASALWLKWTKLLSLLIALAIGTGIVVGEAGGLSLLQMKAEVYDAKHEEIIRLRDAGDPSVYTKRFKQGYLTCESRPFKRNALNWMERAFYNLEYSLSENPYAPKDSASP